MKKVIDTVENTPLLLIAEDDLDDRILVEEALLENGVSTECITFVGDGQELLDTLATMPAQPTLILLDLNMPRLDGRQTLQTLKSDARYQHIPVLVFTTSNSPDDIELTRQHGANSFFTKPTSFVGLTEIFALIQTYWFQHAAAPLARLAHPITAEDECAPSLAGQSPGIG